jgi:hypothetical protein
MVKPDSCHPGEDDQNRHHGGGYDAEQVDQNICLVSIRINVSEVSLLNFWAPRCLVSLPPIAEVVEGIGPSLQASRAGMHQHGVDPGPTSNNPNRPTGQRPTDRMESIRTLLNLCPLRHSSYNAAVVVKAASQAAFTEWRVWLPNHGADALPTHDAPQWQRCAVHPATLLPC